MGVLPGLGEPFPECGQSGWGQSSGPLWTWPRIRPLAPLPSALRSPALPPTAVPGRSPPRVLLKPGAVAQGGEEAPVFPASGRCGSSELGT